MTKENREKCSEMFGNVMKQMIDSFCENNIFLFGKCLEMFRQSSVTFGVKFGNV